jgi:ERCC4-type nuclease
VVAITADVFEQESRVPRYLRDLGASVTLERLAVGDYVVSTASIVERKHVVDLHHSLVKGRLWPQVGRLRKASSAPYLLVEGRDLAGTVNPSAIRGALLAIGDLGVTVIRSTDPRDSAAWLYRLAHRRQHGAPIRVRPGYAQRPQAPPDEVAEAMLAAVPGISRTMARRLLDEFGTVARLAAADPTQWIRVAGVGETRAAALAGALTAERGTSHSAQPNGYRAT